MGFVVEYSFIVLIMKTVLKSKTFPSSGYNPDSVSEIVLSSFQCTLFVKSLEHEGRVDKNPGMNNAGSPDLLKNRRTRGVCVRRLQDFFTNCNLNAFPVLKFLSILSALFFVSHPCVFCGEGFS